MMRSNVVVLGWLYIVLGVLGLVTALCVGLILAGSGLISGDETAILVLGIIAAVVVFFLLLTSLPGIIAGAGLLKFQPWARILAIILGVLNLPGFPVGTALGIFTLYVLLDTETSSLFTQ